VGLVQPILILFMLPVMGWKLPFYSDGRFLYIQSNREKYYMEKSLGFWEWHIGNNRWIYRFMHLLKERTETGVRLTFYRTEWESLARALHTTDSRVVFKNHRVYCEKCGYRFSNEILKGLVAASVYPRVTMSGLTSQQLDAIRNERCPKCGYRIVTIKYSLKAAWNKAL
jgi:predicted Zn-ribbon and HTH transcriptional regulator